MSWHVFNVEVILEKRISHGSSLVSITKSLSKQSWIFLIKQDVDSWQLHCLFRILPVALVLLWARQEFGHFQPSPEAESISILPETLSRNFNSVWSWLCRFFTFLSVLLFFNGSKLAFWSSSFEVHPSTWSSCIHFLIVIAFEWKPSSWSFLWVSEFNVLNFEI